MTNQIAALLFTSYTEQFLLTMGICGLLVCAFLLLTRPLGNWIQTGVAVIVFWILFGTLAFVMAREMKEAGKSHAKELAEMILNPETEFSLTRQPGGEERLTLTLPEVIQKSQTTVLGKEVPSRTILRPRQEATLNKEQLKKLQNSQIRLADGILLNEKISQR